MASLNKIFPSATTTPFPRETQSDGTRKELEECMATRPCPACRGDRLSEISRAVTVGGMRIADFCRLPVTEALEFMEKLELEGSAAVIAEQILKEIREKEWVFAA